MIENFTRADVASIASTLIQLGLLGITLKALEQISPVKEQAKISKVESVSKELREFQKVIIDSDNLSTELKDAGFNFVPLELREYTFSELEDLQNTQDWNTARDQYRFFKEHADFSKRITYMLNELNVFCAMFLVDNDLSIELRPTVSKTVTAIVENYWWLLVEHRTYLNTDGTRYYDHIVKFYNIAKGITGSLSDQEIRIRNEILRDNQHIKAN